MNSGTRFLTQLLALLAFALLGAACSMDMREMAQRAAPESESAEQPESALVSEVRPQFLYSYASW